MATSIESDFLNNTQTTPQQLCNNLSKSRVIIELLAIRNNTFYYTGILIILSLIGILLTWYILTRTDVSLLKWILTVAFIVIITLAIYLFINTQNIYNRVGIPTNTLRAS